MMFEFAIALLLYRRNTEKRNKWNQIDVGGLDYRKDSEISVLERKGSKNGLIRGETYLERFEKKQREPTWPDISSNTVDIIASFLFPFAYLIFNIGYWVSLE